MEEKLICQHHWIPLLGRQGKENVPTQLFTCLKCGELKVGRHTIKISKYRLDMGDLPIYASTLKLQFGPTNDNTASGLYISVTVDTNTNGIGSPLMVAADGHYDDANASASTTSPAVVLALETGTGTKKVLVHGVMRHDAWNWTTGPGTASLIYVAASAGTLTQTQPTGTDNVIQPVGYALSADDIYFCPSMIYFTHT